MRDPMPIDGSAYVNQRGKHGRPMRDPWATPGATYFWVKNMGEHCKSMGGLMDDPGATYVWLSMDRHREPTGGHWG